MNVDEQRNGPGVAHNPLGLKRLWNEGSVEPVSSRWNLVGQQALIAWRAFLAAPVTSLLTVAIIGVVLLLFSAFLLAAENVGRVLSEARGGLHLSLYLREGVEAAELDRLAGEVKGLPEVESVELFPKDRNLDLFRKSLGPDAVILDGLEAENPIPASLEVRFKEGESSSAVFERYAERFRADPSVDLAHYNRGLVGQLGATLRSFRTVTTAAAFCMLLVTGVVVSNAIRLALHSHRDEIEIMRLVGATDAFVRTPYVIEGGAQGLLGAAGGLAGLFILGGILRGLLLRDPLLATVVPSFRFLSLGSLLLVLGTGTLVGAAGSWFAVRRFIVSHEQQ